MEIVFEKTTLPKYGRYGAEEAKPGGCIIAGVGCVMNRLTRVNTVPDSRHTVV
jgi:hypothetical protein